MYSASEMNDPVSFPGWAEALSSGQKVCTGRKEACRRAILSYLRHLKDHRLRASLASAKAYFEEAVRNDS